MQVGGGGPRVRNVFSGSTYQRGRGVGAWLGGLARMIIPYIRSGAKVVGKEAIRTGLNVLDDVTNNNANFKEALKSRAMESGKVLKRKATKKIVDMMKGSGIKSRNSKRRRQSKKRSVTARNSISVRKKKNNRNKKKKSTKRKKAGKRKKTLRDITDIFGPR